MKWYEMTALSTRVYNLEKGYETGSGFEYLFAEKSRKFRSILPKYSTSNASILLTTSKKILSPWIVVFEWQIQKFE